MVNDLYDVGEGDFDDFAVGALNLDAGLGEGLCGLHAADDAAHAISVFGDDFDIIFIIERPERRESFCYFHCCNLILSLKCFLLITRGLRTPDVLIV